MIDKKRSTNYTNEDELHELKYNIFFIRVIRSYSRSFVDLFLQIILLDFET
jgi:hypothetical protein